MIYSLLLKIDWKTILMGQEKWEFLPEAIFRSVVMFIVIIMSLRLLGKRGVKQLSVFELGVIIGLGSAAGDPMFYSDVGLLAGIVVFMIVMSLYKLITFFINRSDKFENFMEGQAASIIKDGQMLVKNFKKEPIARDELYSQLRLNNISHLGQVALAIIETNGEISVFFLKDDEVKYGLPILPGTNLLKSRIIKNPGKYACNNCGNVLDLPPSTEVTCECCGHKEWVPAWNNVRIT
jgi:uncharacterized membrane protein YcaP (DUF421 family)